MFSYRALLGACRALVGVARRVALYHLRAAVLRRRRARLRLARQKELELVVATVLALPLPQLVDTAARRPLRQLRALDDRDPVVASQAVGLALQQVVQLVRVRTVGVHLRKKQQR
ncbi:MAG: hypothetical protein ACKVI4_13450 [Actinomycetales bacterium]